MSALERGLALGRPPDESQQLGRLGILADVAEGSVPQ